MNVVMYKRPKDPTVRVSFILVYKNISLFLARFHSVHTGGIHDQCKNPKHYGSFLAVSTVTESASFACRHVLSIIEANRA